MSRRWLLSLLCLSLGALFLVQPTRARYDLRVDEAKTKLTFQELAPDLSLAVVNGSGRTLAMTVHVELVDPNDAVAVAVTKKLSLGPGNQVLTFTLPARTRDFSPDEKQNILLYRLRYRLTPELNSNDANPVEGIISVSQITPDLFDLRVAATEFLRPGLRYRSTVTALHPVTHKPAPNVDIRGLIKFHDDNSNTETRITTSAKTNKDGFAQLAFDIPNDIKGDDFELTVEGTRGLLIVDVEKDLNFFSRPYVIISTDKPLYQPGQTLFTRALILNVARHPLPGKSLTMTITDPENQVVHEAELKTSRFGIANSEWTIPEGTPLGDYDLVFKTDDDDDESYSTRVKISRYELPTFTVNVKPDRSFYLEGQRATVEVKADYLFGKPVTRGHVRVVQETERHWNYAEQHYDTVEGDKYEGNTDADSAFKATIDLTADQRELRDSDYQRFTDVPYAAYFTDESTNRTEQRRFKIRVTKEPIHVYAITPNSSYYQTRHLPFSFYLTTFYADGTPAQCTVSIIEHHSSGSESNDTLRRVRTNQYGIAKVENLTIPPNPSNEADLTLSFQAIDKSGAVGRHSETFNFDNGVGLSVVTPKTLFAPGEPIQATIRSSESNSVVTLAVVRDWNVLSSQQVKLKNARATLLLPFSKDYKGEITLVAYVNNGNEENTVASRSVMFPRYRDLNLKLAAEAKTYLPGENAHVTFRSVSAVGKAVESALGIVVLDQAVEERIRTDQEFGSYYSDLYSNYFSLLEDRESLSGITRKALEQLDHSKPIGPDLDLAAEVLLNQNRAYYPYFFGDEYRLNAESEYTDLLKAQLNPIAVALENAYTKAYEYPSNETSLSDLLARSGIDFKALRDPWGIPYSSSFFTDRDSDVLVLNSAGPDKAFNTRDDLTARRFSWHYFYPTGRLIEKVTQQYHDRTGSYIVDYDTLRRELLAENFDLDKLRDRWGQKYKFTFSVEGSYYSLNVVTSAPNTITRSDNKEFSVCYSRIDYFAETRAKIDRALAKRALETKTVPQNETELYKLISSAGVSRDNLRDPFNNPYYFIFSTTSHYVDDVQMQARSNEATVKIKPVTQTTTNIFFKSPGPDRTVGTGDDFPVATFHANATQQSAEDATPQVARVIGTYSGSTGAITGTVVDPSGAVVPGATCKAKHINSNQEYEGESDDEGKYIIRNLPAGMYELTLDANGFKQSIISGVFVRSSTLIEVNVTLEVGAVTETVSVVSSDVSVKTTSASTSSVKKVSTVKNGAFLPKQLLSTPRIRGFFPETLLWQPELTTDKQGRAQLDFKLADNITTWKMSVIGSTEEGEIGTAETEIRAFQPFFAELDPPRVLTQGDRVSLPVVLRNYLDKKQTVNLELRPESWFSIDGPNQTKVQIAAGDSSIKSFNFEAHKSVKDGKQRVTAIGSEFSDAIEKTVDVHPDGEERSDTAGTLFESSASLEVELPRETIPNSNQLELKIYPNLMSHVWESIEGSLQRPHGCAEQTISSAYPSLMVLRSLDKDKRQSANAQKAQRYLEEGHQRLLSYQSSDGGFPYWSGGTSDVALTAYAIRFLIDAGDVIPVSGSVIERAKSWLLKQQRTDGSWPSFDWQNHEDLRRTTLLTALVAKSLAFAQRKNVLFIPTVQQTPLQQALNYLQKKLNEIPEPYVLACYSLAATTVSDHKRAEEANSQLLLMAHSEGTGSYWNLETNTPFYGWGLTGRLETTALVLEALSATEPPPALKQASKNLESRALMFLLMNKDRYGVWYSGQATVNVLGAMLAMLKGQPESTQGSPVEVSVNGQPTNRVALPPGRFMAPLTVDLSSQIRTGHNLIQLKRAAGPFASVQLVNTYYVPWRSDSSSTAARVRSGDSESLHLETSFNKTTAKVMEEVTCSVRAERIGFRGYGMLLAEIGVPPGADVDRESLETAMIGPDSSINRYDILPDRVVLYLWPRAGGSRFSFKFRPRLAMKAKNSQSIIYDYYNPEAQAVLAPETFSIR